MSWFFAWADATETTFGATHHRYDEAVVDLRLAHAEGGFARLTVTLKNPRVGLLNPARQKWVWVALANAPVTPLFFGRIEAVPSELTGDAVTVDFVARPDDYQARKVAAAAALRVAPYYDPVWLAPEDRMNPDSVLEARAADWHIDPVTHAVTATDAVQGEDGTLVIAAADVDGGSVTTSKGEIPLRKFRVEAEVRWIQQAKGVIDITRMLTDAFAAAGTSKDGMVSSYTGDGLYDDWPLADSDIGAGWSVARADLTRADGVVFKPKWKKVKAKYNLPPEKAEKQKAATILSPGIAIGIGTSGGAGSLSLPNFQWSGYTPGVKLWYREWFFVPDMRLRYEARRDRIETLVFELVADVQAMSGNPGSTETEVIALSSSAVGDKIDAGGARPIGAFRRRSYFNTARGLRSLAWLIAKARARMLRRARAVDVSFTLRGSAGLAVSLRKSAQIASPRLPGGVATGKIKAFEFRAGGDGVFACDVTIGCLVGRGTMVAALAGTPDYVQTGYVGTGWQTVTGETVAVVPGAVTHGAVTPVFDDDGLNLAAMTAAASVETLTVVNGPSAQETMFDNPPDGKWHDAPQVLAALNAAETKVQLQLKPVTGGPYTTTYDVTVSGLAVPKSIDLEAA